MLLSIEELKRLLPGARIDARGKNLRATCPKCNHNEFGISLEDNHRFGCYRKRHCGFVGNIFTLLAFLGKSVADVAPTFFPKSRIDSEKLFVHEDHKLSLEIPDCKMPIGWKRIYHSDYLTNERGFEVEDYKTYKVGVTGIDPRYKDDYVIFAIEQFGSNKAYVARNIRSKKQIEAINALYKRKGIDKAVRRYLNSNSDFSKILLGVEELTPDVHTVIIVEGLFDKKNTDKQLGLNDEKEIKCCATFKCGVSAEQMFLLQQFGVRKIILLYDPDVVEEINKAAWELDNYFEVLIGFCVNDKDPGDMDGDEFIQTLDNLKSPSQFVVSKIDAPIFKKS